MIVYRFMTESEFLLWHEGNKNMGTEYDKCVENTHNYKSNEKYLHFFKNLFDAASVLSVLDSSVNYLCKFDIDKTILKNFEGKGSYFANGEVDAGKIEVVEYAIPAKLLSKNNLKSCRKVRDENSVKFLTEDMGWNNVSAEDEMTI